jgi:hypothetical protein
LRPELDAREAEATRVVEEATGRPRYRRASAQILVGIRRKADVVNREQHATHAELLEAIANRV